ncbi:hypothetical protein R4282_01940 [Rhodococcus oxybenzonivorans]|nr:hypothetical protein [Rhodococcus oxybenzonivorans]MDV7351776.1 hypothetical protein [Rhodococcus oxybenzonivorans]
MRHEWSPVYRWAIALGDGRLAFADPEDLTLDPGTPAHRNPGRVRRAADQLTS